MVSYFFWDIENVSFHNLERIMKRVNEIEGEKKLYTVYSKIKESRKVQLGENDWILVLTDGISKNSADFKIKEMINSLLEEKNNNIGRIILITEDKGFFKTAQQIKAHDIQVEIICGTKNPQWIKDLKLRC